MMIKSFFSLASRKKKKILRQASYLENHCECFDAIIEQDDAYYKTMKNLSIVGNAHQRKQCSICERIYEIKNGRPHLIEKFSFEDVVSQ